MRLFDDVTKTQRGASITLAPGQESGIIRAYGPDELAQVVTVQISVVDIDRISFVSNPLLKVTGTVRWGIGGQQDYAEVDVLGGCLLSVPASFIEVIARNESLRPTDDLPFFSTTVSAAVGYGSRAPTGIPGAFKTVEYAESATDPTLPIQVGGLSQRKTIPRWAGAAVVVYRSQGVAAAVGSVTLLMFDSNGRVIYEVEASSGDSIPIVTPAFFITILNNTTQPIRGFIQYALII
jgi:hypothetical protein